MEHAKVIDMYRAAFQKFGDSDNAVFFPKGRQYVRYGQMLAGYNGQDSILDYGCGLGKLYRFVSEFYPDARHLYHGVDIVSDFIENNIAAYQDTDFKLITEPEDLEGSQYDIVLASGTFNIIADGDCDAYSGYVKSTLTKLFQTCSKKLIVDFMHDQVDFIQPGAFHININDMSAFIEQNLSSRFIVNRSYMPFEVSFTVYKDIELSDKGVYSGGY